MLDKDKVRDLTMGAVLSAVICIPIFINQGYFKPIPYSYVTVNEVIKNETSIEVVATFVKTDLCRFRELGAFGESLGQWTRLTWSDPEGERGDRFPGYQTLHVEIHTEGIDYNQVELRTRHDCDGVRVDRIFLNEDL